MRPCTLSVAFALALGLGAGLSADDTEPDTIKAELDKAKEAYRAAAAKARVPVLEAFAEEKAAAGKNAKLKAADKLALLDRLDEQRKAFEAEGTLPKSPGPRLKKAGDDYLKEMKSAREACDKAFERAAEAYIAAGRREDARAVLKAKEGFLKDGALAADAGKREQWMPLFDGKSLDGWKATDRSNTRWAVARGGKMLTGIGGGFPNGALYYVHEPEMEEFKLRVVVLEGKRGEILVRGRPHTTGYEGYLVSCDAEGGRPGTVSLFRPRGREFNRPLAEAKPTKLKPGEGYTVEITAKKNTITVAINGQAVASAVDALNHFPKGGVALRSPLDGQAFSVRSVELLKEQAGGKPPVPKR